MPGYALRMRAFAICLVVASSSVAFAKPKKLTVWTGNGELTLTFDPKKISKADLTAAAALAPDSNPSSVTIGHLNTCRDRGTATTPCVKPTPASPTFFRDAELTIKENLAIVKLATERPVPKELEPAKEWLRKQTAFWAGLEERKLAFYKSWKSADLAPPIENIDGSKACAPIVIRIARGIVRAGFCTSSPSVAMRA